MRQVELIWALALAVPILARYEDRYDMRKLPYDLRPITEFIGMWELTNVNGHFRDLAAPSQIDISINPIPKFGARTANITHTYFDRFRNVVKSDYGFMPVKNTTRRDPRIHVAYLTSSSDGYSMMEQGTVEPMARKMQFHLKQYLKRTFDVGMSGSLDVREFERQFNLNGNYNMDMKVRAETNHDTEAYTASYRKIM